LVAGLRSESAPSEITSLGGASLKKLLGLELGCHASQHPDSLHVVLNLLFDSFSEKVGGGFRKICILGQALNISVKAFKDLCALDVT